MLTIVPDREDLQNVAIVEPRTTIGAHPSNVMVAQSATVSDFHAEFRVQNDEIFLLDLGSDTGTTLNGEAISSRVKVKHNDIVKVGDMGFKLIDSDLKSEEQVKDSNATEIRSVVTGWVLVGKSGSLLPGELPIEGIMSVGRDETCDIFIPVSHISRQHAQFEIVDSKLKVKDLGSANGTMVNGEKIIEAELQPGDIIFFDTEEFLISGSTKDEAASTGKTQVREVITEVNKVISEGVTDSGKPWKESDVKADNETAVISPVQVEPDSANAMPPVDQELVARLECTTKPMVGKKFDLLKKINTVGRTDGNDIKINESSVSSKHAIIIQEKGSWLIQDLDSYNGTFVNNIKCKSKKLKTGDVIKFGRVQLIFSTESAGRVATSLKSSLSGLKVPILLVKTIVLLVVVSVISEFVYNYISGLKFF